MVEIYRLLEWLKTNQAIDYLNILSGAELIDRPLFLQLCESRLCDVYVDLPYTRGIRIASSFDDYEDTETLIGLCHVMYDHSELLGTPASGRQHFTVYSLQHKSVIELEPPRPVEAIFRPSDIEALARLIKEKPATTTPKLNNEPNAKTRNAYLRTIAALGEALVGGFTGQPHKDADAILAALAAKGIKDPIKKDALANYLKQAEEI